MTQDPQQSWPQNPDPAGSWAQQDPARGTDPADPPAPPSFTKYPAVDSPYPPDPYPQNPYPPAEYGQYQQGQYPLPPPSPYGQAAYPQEPYPPGAVGPAYPQAPYGVDPYGRRPSPPPNGMAIASMVLGILWLFWLGSILALIFGYVARNQIRHTGESGDGMAIAGIVLGWVGVGILVLSIVATAAGAAGG